MTGGVSGVDSTSTQGASNAQYRFLQKYNAGSEYPNVGIGLVPDFDDISFDSYGDNMSAFGAGYVPPQNWQAPQFLGVPQNTAYDPNTMQRTGGYPPASGTVATQTNRTTQMRYGYGPEIEEGMTQAQINKKYEEWEDHLLERQLEKQQKAETAQMRTMQSDIVIAEKLEKLQRQVKNEEQDKMIGAYDELLQAIKDKYLVDGKLPKGMTEKQLNAMAKAELKQLYQASSPNGTSLIDDIDAHSSNSVWQGFKQSWGFGFADETCGSEIISHIDDEKAPGSAKAGKIFGNVLGFASSFVPGLGWFGWGAKAVKAATVGAKGAKAASIGAKAAKTVSVALPVATGVSATGNIINNASKKDVEKK